MTCICVSYPLSDWMLIEVCVVFKTTICFSKIKCKVCFLSFRRVFISPRRAIRSTFVVTAAAVFVFPVFSRFSGQVGFCCFSCFVLLTNLPALSFQVIARVYHFIHRTSKSHLSVLSPMDGLSESYAKFSTRPPEEEEIAVDEDPILVNRMVESQKIIGRIVSPKILSELAIKMHLTCLVQPVRDVTLQELGPNKFILRLAHPRDCALAMVGSMWLAHS